MPLPTAITDAHGFVHVWGAAACKPRWVTYADFARHRRSVLLNPEWLRLGPEADIVFMVPEAYREIHVGPPPATIAD